MTVRKRHVFFVSGYDPQGAPGYFRLFNRELKRYQKITGVETDVIRTEYADDEVSATWRVATNTGAWQVDTTYEFLRWDQFVCQDFRRSMLTRLPLALLTFCDYLFSGTLFRILKRNWRFGLFWIYPFITIALLLGLSAFAGNSLQKILFEHTQFSTLLINSLAIVFGISIFYTAVWLSKYYRLYMVHMLDDWIYNMQHLRHCHHKTNQRMQSFVKRVIAVAHANQVDEILLVGHSSGSFHVIELAAEVLKAEPRIAQYGPSINVMSIGSAISLIACHPSAQWMRDAIHVLAKTPDIFWIEYQSRKDILNFFNFDPVCGNGVNVKLSERQAMLYQPIRFRDMLKHEIYQRNRLNFFRLHFQFIMANDFVNCPYDYMDIILGPRSIKERCGVAYDIKVAVLDDVSS